MHMLLPKYNGVNTCYDESHHFEQIGNSVLNMPIVTYFLCSGVKNERVLTSFGSGLSNDMMCLAV